MVLSIDCQVYFLFCVVPITRSCFPLTYSDDTLDGRCYDRQCYIYSGAEKPINSNTIWLVVASNVPNLTI